MLSSKRNGLFAALAASAVAAVMAPGPAAGEMAVDAVPGHCAVSEVRYVTSGILHIAETKMGAGDGYFPVGPGTLVLRVDAHTGHVELAAFELHERFAIRPNAALWSATVTTDAWAHLAPNARPADVQGRLAGDGVLHWSAPLRSYRSDGALVCDGTLCGKFGAPASGRTELHAATAEVRLEPLRLARDGATFQMDYTLVSESQSPHQKTYLALAGRRAQESCLPETGAVATSNPTSN
jgi:hypothetical protein